MASREHAIEGHTQSGNSWGRVALLAVGDVVVFLVFAIAGRSSHGSDNAVLNVITTAGPFMLAWFVVAPFLGLFRQDVTSNPRKMAQRTILGWLIACPIGVLLRALMRGYIPEVSFWLVTFAVILVFFFIWRLPFAWLTRTK